MKNPHRELANRVLVEGRSVAYTGSVSTLLAIATFVFTLGGLLWDILLFPAAAGMVLLFVAVLRLNRRCDELGRANNALAGYLEVEEEEPSD